MKRGEQEEPIAANLEISNITKVTWNIPSEKRRNKKWDFFQSVCDNLLTLQCYAVVQENKKTTTPLFFFHSSLTRTHRTLDASILLCTHTHMSTRKNPIT